MASTFAAPTSDAFFQDWVPLGGGSRWSELDDIVSPDGDTSYVSSSTHLEACSFNGGPAISIPSGATVDNVRVVSYAKLASGNGWLRFFAAVNGSATITPDSPIALPVGAYDWRWGEFLVNPDTGVAWTKADVEGTSGSPLGLLWGFFNHNPDSQVRVSNSYLEVNYTTGGGGGAVVVPIVMHQMRLRRG